MTRENLWVMIPARGGSQGVPRKNVRRLGSLPLIGHSITAALETARPDQIIVITDDDEISAVAKQHGVRVVREPKTTGKATLDEVALRVAHDILDWGGASSDIFLTIQPTCPFLRGHRLAQAIELFDAGAGAVLTVVDDRHLTWRIDDNGEPAPAYEARVNRQQLPSTFRETGGVIGCRLGSLLEQGSRIVPPVRIIEVSKEEAVDIDDFTDWAVADYLISRKRVAIRCDAGTELGMGHAYRSLALAQELAGHDVTIICDLHMPLGAELISQHPFPLIQVDGTTGFLSWLSDNRHDLVILDQLDTSAEYVRSIKAFSDRVVSFEDLGPGSLDADLVVSDLYKNLSLPDERQLTGVVNAILAPNFETDCSPAEFHDKVENILVVFGGSDPSHLTERALQALADIKFNGRTTVILGPGVKRDIDLADYGLSGEILRNVRHMPGVIRRMDLAFSSAGRTVTELISFGVPVICLCQNDKELGHTHASARFGVLNLGLGRLADQASLAAHLEWLIHNAAFRETLRTRALHETRGRSNATVIQRMMSAIGWS